MKNLSLLKKLNENAPEPMKALWAFDKEGFTAGLVDALHKQLMAVSVALTTQCPYCIELHVKAARQAGATDQMLAETAVVAAAMRGRAQTLVARVFCRRLRLVSNGIAVTAFEGVDVDAVSMRQLEGAIMSFLPILPDDQTSAEAREIYDYVRSRWGFLPNYFQASAHDVRLLKDQVDLYTDAMFDERGLPKMLKEQIATVVSGINMSSYCLPAHLEILGRLGMDKSLSRRLSIDYKSASLEPKNMELLKFCEKLTLHPADMQRADIENLRESGWSDAAIYDAVLITSLYACANRFSAGLGLTPDFD
jgi:uncharacterized peroxidase-related enzyme